MAPSPVFVGYSLVGVYPCAVWKPQPVNSPTNNSSASLGPIRNARTTNNRVVPYTTANVRQPPPTHPHHHQQHQQQQQPQPNPVQILPLRHQNQTQPLAAAAPIVPLAGICPTDTTNTTIQHNHHQPIIVKACSCNNSTNTIGTSRSANNSTNNNVSTEVQSATTTQMLFVPFSVPNFAPPMTASTLQNNNYSPSKVNKDKYFIC